MKTPKEILSNLSSKQILAVTAPVVLITAFVCVTAYYYVKTPANVIIVTADDIPAGLSASFTSKNFTDQVVADLEGMYKLLAARDTDKFGPLRGLGRPGAAKEDVIPFRAASGSPSPIFNLKWNGIDLNLCRVIGMSLKAKAFLDLGVIGLPDKGWRLTALVKGFPSFTPQFSGSAPRGEGACSDLEKCARDLGEQILGSLDNRSLLNYYIRVNTPDANRRILSIYQAIPADSLQADDFVAWGNAYYELKQFDQALEKYQAALSKDSNSCAARAARGFVYYSRPHGPADIQLPDDLRRAEEDFRAGIVCDSKNEYTRTSLCHTLLLKWSSSPSTHDSHSLLLVQAKEQCDKALEINPGFVIAAINTSYILYKQGNHDAALHAFDDISQRFPTNSALFLNYGFLLYREYLSDYNVQTLRQATARTRQAWDLDPKNYIAADNLGYFYYEQGDYSQAADFWNKADALQPNEADTLAGLALSKFKQGDVPASTALLTRAIRIEPDYRNPTRLVEHSDWSTRMAADLAKVIEKLPAS